MIIAFDKVMFVAPVTTSIFLFISCLLFALPLYVKLPLLAETKPFQVSPELRTTLPPSTTTLPARFTFVSAEIELPEEIVKRPASKISKAPAVATNLPFEVNP